MLDSVVSALTSGEIIAYPSEGVWGLGCDPHNRDAVKKILKIKERSMTKGLIVVGSRISHLEKFANIKKYEKIFKSKWPGPHTWIFPTDKAPEWITGGSKSIALRLSNHKIIKIICDAYSGAIVSTSANKEGQKASKTIHEVRKNFPDIFYVKGETGNLEGSTPIQDIVSLKWIRR